LVRLKTIDFDSNLCIGWSSQNSIEALNETIVSNCTVGDKTKLEWLEDFVAEIKMGPTAMTECAPTSYELPTKEDQSSKALREKIWKLETDNETLQLKLSMLSNDKQVCATYKKLGDLIGNVTINDENQKTFDDINEILNGVEENCGDDAAASLES
jgi:hypothetical protein